MNSEKGQAVLLALIALGIGALVTAPFLGHASSSLIGSRIYGQAIAERYSADAGVEHAIWRLKYEPDFADSLTAESPTANYSITINNMTNNITVTRIEDAFPPEPPPPPEGPQAWRIQIAKSVEPNSAPVGEPETFTYTIYIENVGTSTVHIVEIGDLLPIGFIYETGTSSGVTFEEPIKKLEGGQQELVWGFSEESRPSVDGGETVTQVFQATATPEEDIYWNTAWVTLDPTSIGTIGTGSSAPVGGGGCSPYVYDLVSTAAGTTIHAQASIGDTGVSILSWQVK
ncbi:hypothetical protein ES703_24019 [subsurface metagenome]